MPSADNINHGFHPLVTYNINHVVFMLNSGGLELQELTCRGWASSQLLLRGDSQPAFNCISRMPCGFYIV